MDKKLDEHGLPMFEYAKDISDDGKVYSMIDKYLDKFSSKIDEEFLREFLFKLIKNRIFPLHLLNNIPISAGKALKTRFDQIYDVVINIKFPNYHKKILDLIFGLKNEDRNEDIKIWKAIFSKDLKIQSVFIRAESMQQAYSYACDYALRVHLRSYYEIPNSLAIKISYMSNRSIKRYFKIKFFSKKRARKKYLFMDRTFTNKQMNGARICGLCPKSNKNYSIFKYMEEQDLRKIKNKNIIRKSVIEKEFQDY